MRQRCRWSLGTFEVLGKHLATVSRQRDRRGLLAVSWLALYQVFIPLTGPIVDTWLLLSIAFSSHRLLSLLVLMVMTSLEILLVSVGLLAEREDWRLLMFAPFVRFLWRPIQLRAACQSGWKYMQSRQDPWHRLVRNDSVPLLEPTHAGQSDAGYLRPADGAPAPAMS